MGAVDWHGMCRRVLGRLQAPRVGQLWPITVRSFSQIGKIAKYPITDESQSPDANQRKERSCFLSIRTYTSGMSERTADALEEALTHIKELEREVQRLRFTLAAKEGVLEQRAAFAKEQKANVEYLEAKLVERDVYEAQQRLPPEQAALIKHLATVERCIEEGRYDVDGMDPDDMYCGFCARIEGHDKDCAWLALQFDRKPAETMVLVEGWAWEENDRRDRERARAMTPQRPGPGRYTMTGLSEWLKNLYPEDRVQDVPTGSALIASLGDPLDFLATSEHPATQRQAGRTTNFGLPYPEPLTVAMRVTTSPFVPPGKVYVLEGLSSFVTAEETLRVLNERAAPDAPVLEDNANPATVTLDEAPQHQGLEGEPRRARGREDDQEGVPPVDHRPVDGER